MSCSGAECTSLSALNSENSRVYVLHLVLVKLKVLTVEAGRGARMCLGD